MTIELESIKPTQHQTEQLFEMLKNRVHNISHESLPSFNAHQIFVENHPYRAWFFIIKNKKIEGTLYVQNDNSVGLNNVEDLSSDELGQTINMLRSAIEPLEAIPSLRYKDFFFNVSFSNKDLQNKLASLGLQPTQISYI